MFYGRPQPDVPEPPTPLLTREDWRALASMIAITLAICLVIAIAGGIIR